MTQETNKPALLAERITFFFSDANFRNDSFMRKTAASNDGYIEIKTLLKFNSIKAITEDVKEVAEAAKTVDTVVVSKDGEAVRRKDPLPSDDDSKLKTVYVEGIPMEEDSELSEPKVEGEEGKKRKTVNRYTKTVEDVKKLFEPYGKVAIVRMRWSKGDAARNIHKSAQGSCFIEYTDKESVAKCIEAAATGFGFAEGVNVQVFSMEDGLVRINPRRNKKQAATAKQPEAAKSDDPEAPVDDSEIPQLEWTPGRVIVLTGLPSGCDREALKDAFSPNEVYADFSRGESDGSVRFNEDVSDIKDIAAKVVSGDITIAGGKVGGAEVLEGEKEEKYWKDASRAMFERKRAAGKRKMQGRGGGERRHKSQRR